MLPCVIPIIQTTAMLRVTKFSPRVPPSAICATSATQNEGRYKTALRLPHKIKVDVTLRHTCYAKRRNVIWSHAWHAKPSWMGNCYACIAGQQNQPKRATQCHSATPTTQNESRYKIEPCLLNETKMGLTLYHAQDEKKGVTGDQNQPKRGTQCHKCHTYPIKRL